MDPYVGENGYIKNADFVHEPIAALEKGGVTGPVAIVLHRTVSTTATSALEDSVGIEVVAMYYESSKTWDEPTPEQIISIKQLIQVLKNLHSLQDVDIYAHDLISRKTEGEGQGLYSGGTHIPERGMP